MSDDFITHLNASRHIAQRAIIAQTIEVTPPEFYALPGGLVPVHRDRLEAHQDDGLEMREIVEYENGQFLEANAGVRERHARWVGRDYDAMVQVHRELEAQQRAQEMRVKAAYQERLAEILAAKDEEN